MKKLCSIIASVLCIIVLLNACSKPANNPAPTPPPTDTIPTSTVDITPFVKADFSVEASCNASLFTDTLQKVFDPLLFVNKSDAGKNVHYRWLFGDGATSDSANPTHTYSASGTYTVQLITFYDTIPKDTITRLIRIIIGMKNTYVGSTSGVAGADAAPGDGVLALLYKPQLDNTNNYMLLRTDSMLNKIFLQQLPSNVTKLNSLKITKNGNYIISGSYDGSNTTQFVLSMIDTSGNLLWQKALNINGTNYYTAETSDGGFITIGDEIASNNSTFITVAKCDMNGNLIWKQSFTQTPLLNAARNIIETPTGYAFSAERQHDFTFYIKELVITQLDFNGLVTSQDVYSLNWRSLIGAPTSITAAGNTYMAYVPSIDSVLLLDNNLKLKKVRPIVNAAINTISGFDNNYYTSFGMDKGGIIKTDDQGSGLGSDSWITYALKPVVCSNQDVFKLIQTTTFIKGKNDIIEAGYVNNISAESGAFLMRVSKDGEVR